MRVLFVCLGNICRSPTAESVFRAKVIERGLLGEVEVDSAGTGGWHAGNAPDRRAVAEGERRGVSMSGRARQVSASDLRDFDLIIAMDESNRRDLLALATDEAIRERIQLLRDWDPEAAGHDRAVPDPYYGGEREFAEMFDIVERACEGLIADIEQRVR
jgi:protein-tyrosine phosphatase